MQLFIGQIAIAYSTIVQEITIVICMYNCSMCNCNLPKKQLHRNSNCTKIAITPKEQLQLNYILQLKILYNCNLTGFLTLAYSDVILRIMLINFSIKVVILVIILIIRSIPLLNYKNLIKLCCVFAIWWIWAYYSTVSC